MKLLNLLPSIFLSANSPFFERIFAEHPCKHPVIVLQDFLGREVAALIDFMYRGEVRVCRDELPNLMQAAESLQIRGLVSTEPQPASPLDPSMDTPNHLDRLSPDADQDNDSINNIQPEPRTLLNRNERLSHMSHLNFAVKELRETSNSPIPRRKQARPRRRSGELVPQDLSRPHPPPSPSPPGLNLTTKSRSQSPQQPTSQPPSNHTTPQRTPPNPNANIPTSPKIEEIAENLSMKRLSSSPVLLQAEPGQQTESEPASSPRTSPLNPNFHPDGSLQDLPAPGLPRVSVSPAHIPNEYLSSLGQLASQWMPGQGPMDGNPHNCNPPGHYLQEPNRRSVAVFPMDPSIPPLPSANLFQHSGLDRGALLADLHESFKPEAFQVLFKTNLVQHMSKKPKKGRGDSDNARRWSEQHRGMPIGRPKGQHSAPRGGPPRSWTNAELTEALQNVWNKKMTTSQASRLFGIPYNSLLMYVRGKYGKSLKLEKLRKDCIRASGEVMNSLNNNVKAIQPQSSQLTHPIGMPHPGDEAFAHHSLLNSNIPPGFFHDFAGVFPVPVGMAHILPPSEQKNYDSNPGGPSHPNDLSIHSRSPSPSNQETIPQPPQSAPALLQQNGSE
uniref:BTB domain-containing protein n=1 Tax=Bracon brevicornis TaxID=1563983 RepID=A0A6V7IXR5_9HYME